MVDRMHRHSDPRRDRSRRQLAWRHALEPQSEPHTARTPWDRIRIWVWGRAQSLIRDWEDSARPPGFQRDWFRRLFLMIAAIVVVAWGASQCAVELVLDLRHATTSARVINVSPDQRLGSGSATVVFTANGRETTTEVGWAWPDATRRAPAHRVQPRTPRVGPSWRPACPHRARAHRTHHPAAPVADHRPGGVAPAPPPGSGLTPLPQTTGSAGAVGCLGL